MAHESVHGQEMERCISACLDCHRICLETMAHCFQRGGRHTDARHIRLFSDCTEICQTSAHFMLRGSDLHYQTCAVCASVCDRCADACGAFQDDAEMQRCEQACRRCADSCRSMSRGLVNALDRAA